MRLGNALFLLRAHWRFHWSSWVVVALLVAVSAAVMTLISGTTLAVSSAMRRWTEDIFPPTVLTIHYPTPEFSRMTFVMAAAMSGLEHPRLTNEMLDAIHAMPETKRLYPVVVPSFPVYAEATFLGEGFGSDAVAAGIDRELIASDLPDPSVFRPVDWEGGEPVPVLLSSYFVDLFNLLYAPTMDLPPLSEITTIGFEFDLVIGESVLGGSLRTGATRRVPCVIVGLTRNPQLMGVTMPRETVADFERWFGEATGAPQAPRSTYAFLEVHDASQIPAVTGQVTALGLVAESPPDTQRIATLDRLLRLAAAALLTVILGLTLFGGVCLMILQMEHRRPSLVFLHVSGVPTPTIHGLLVGEAGGVVLAAAGLGAWGAAFLLGRCLAWLAGVLPASLPPPELSGLAAAGVATASVLILAGAMTLVAVGVVAAQHRRVGLRPVG